MARPLHISATECPQCGLRFMDIRLFTREEAARKLGCADATIRKWIKDGELEARVWVKGKTGPVVYMIDSWDLEEFMLRHFPKRSSLSLDAANPKARLAYSILRFKYPPGRKFRERQAQLGVQVEEEEKKK